MPTRNALGKGLSAILGHGRSRVELPGLGNGTNSSAIASVSWNPLDRVNLLSIYEGNIEGTLTITFHKRGIYEYHNVPASVYLSLRGAGSPGSYFNENIRNSYSYQRVG